MIVLVVVSVSFRRVDAQGLLPTFAVQGVALHPNDLEYSPNDDLIHPTIIKTEGRIKNALGKYYLYYAPHKHVAISMAYSDSMDGPWTEYKHNPVVEGPSAPDIRWIGERGKCFLWGHRKNSQTELWTSEDGLSFDYHSVSVKASDIGTRNATYSRVYEYPLERYGSKYIMLYSGFIEERQTRCIWLAHSKDAETWTQLKTPLVEPIEGEMNDCYGPALLRWKGRNFITYQDHTTWRGGNLKYVEVDQQFNDVGDQGERHILIDPPSEPPLNDRLRGAEFYHEGDTLYLYSSASKNPRLIVYAKAAVGPASRPSAPSPISDSFPASSTANAAGDAVPKKDKAPRKEPKRKTKEDKRKNKAKKPTSRVAATSLDDVLEGAELETIYHASFDEPLRMIREEELIDGKRFAREPARDVDWVLEGPGEVDVKGGRMHFKNSPDGNAVLWSTREFPENFVAEWDFQHHHPQGTAIVFFAARGAEGGSIFARGLPKRGGNFGNYTRGKIRCYHISYSATDEQGVPRGDTHLKKDILDDVLGGGGKIGAGPSHIDGKTGKPHRIRLAKLAGRIILEVGGVVSFDCTDEGEKGGAAFKDGQIGFRQMRHCIEASYGEFKVQKIHHPL